MKHFDIRIHESDVIERQNVDAKLVFLANAMNAKIMTTDFNLAQMAEFHAVDCLNINSLAKALNPDFSIGEICNVELVKKGKEPGPAVGF